MLVHLGQGLTSLGNGPDILYLFAGALIGMFLGVIPGLGGSVVLSIILAFIYHIDLTGTICLFLGTHAGSYFSASVTSILLNTPAHPEAFAVTFDGFPMAQKGQAGRALGISATSTCIGGFIGCAVLVGFIQIINTLPNLFHPPEYVALVVIAMLLVGTLGTDSVGKAIISAGIGFMVASIGPSIITGTFRYTFNAVGLYSGVSLVALALGSFAIPQMILVFGTGTTIARQDMTGREIDAFEAVKLEKGFGRQVIAGIAETFRHYVLLIQSGLIGAITGIIPGIGGFAANFLSYGVAQQTSRKKRALFGTGIAEGIIAPEGSSLSKEAGSLIPIIGLGIPGSIGGALFLAALTIKGVKTGYGFTTQYPGLAYQMVWIVALAGLIGTVAGVLVAPFLAKVTRVPGPLLVPFVMSLAVLGPYLANISFFTVLEVLVFAVIGLVLRRLRYSLSSFAVGLVLGPTFETNIYLTRNIYPGFTFLERRPFADVLLVIAIGILVLKIVQIRSDKRTSNAAEDAALAAIPDEEDRVRHRVLTESRKTPYPLLALVSSILLFGVSSAYVGYGWASYDFSTAVMPVIGGLLVAVPALTKIPVDARAYVRYRRAKSTYGVITNVAFASAAPVPVSGLSIVGGIVGTRALTSSVLESPTDLVAQVTPIAAPVSDGFPVIVEKAWGRSGQYTRELFAFLLLFGLVAACYVFGFQFGVPLFVGFYGLFLTQRFLSIRQRVIFTVFSAAAMWGVTYEIFKVLHLAFTPVVKL